MYSVSSPATLLDARRRIAGDRATRVSPVVLLLGLTSLFTDVATEMVVTVLPLYLVEVGRFSPAAFGVVDGIQGGGAALAGLAAGFAGDRWRRHKDVAAAGYGLSAVVKLGLATAGTALSAIVALTLADRIGKGIRTAPRDAMISLATPEEELGAAFGVHRALDTAGAMLGPLVAFAILAAAADAYDSVFLVAFCFALLGFGTITLLVPRPPSAGPGPAPRRPGLREGLRVVRLPRFRALLVAAGALSLASASDAFVFLVLTERVGLDLGLFPLLFVGMTAIFMALAAPCGRLADRVGRGRVLLGGHLLVLGVYAALLLPVGGTPLVLLVVVLLGASYAARDGVLAALASSVVPGPVRGSGLALLNTTTGAANLLSSVAFGALWALAGSRVALLGFGAALVAAVGLAALLLARSRGAAGKSGGAPHVAW